MKKKPYYPTPTERRRAHKAITALCKRMIKEKVVDLWKYEPEMVALRSMYPGYADEFLELEPEEMIRRHKMGIEAAKVLVIREK